MSVIAIIMLVVVKTCEAVASLSIDVL